MTIKSRMLTGSKTTHIRAYKEQVKEWRSLFPEVKTADLIAMAWKTSPIRIEAYLRKNKRL